MENHPKRARSAARFTGNVIDAASKARKTSSAMREKPRVEVLTEKKEGTTMTKEKRLGFLTLLQSLMSHPYGVAFKDVEILRERRPQSFKKLAKPIDLEIVKSTLESNLYFTIEAFAEDVRTTFSNTMQIFSAADEAYKTATRLSEHFESGLKIKVESFNNESKTCNDVVVSEKKETQVKKTDSSSRKRKSAVASSDSEKIFFGQRESDRKGNGVSVAGTHLVERRDEKSLDIVAVSSATKKSAVIMSPTRTTRIASLMDRFSATIKKAEKELSASTSIGNDRKKEEKSKRETDAKLKVKEHNLCLPVSKDWTSLLAKGRDGKKAARSKVLSASAPTDSDQKKVARLKVEEKSERERMVQLQEQRKREREALERMKNTAQFGADHEALKEFEEWLLEPQELAMTENSRRLAENIGGTHLVKGTEGKSFNVTVVSKSHVSMSPIRTTRIASLMDGFSATIKEAEKELSASDSIDNDRKKEEKSERETDAKLKAKEHDLCLTVSKDSTSQLEKERDGKKAAHSKVLSVSAPTYSDRKKEAELKVEEKSERERKVHLQEQRKREREAVERMENTAQFGADHEAIKEFKEWLLGHSR